MKNPYRRTDHRLAFDQAVKLINSGVTDYLEVGKRLDHSISRQTRRKIAARAARLFGYEPKRSRAPLNTLDVPIAQPRQADEVKVLAMWLETTPEQRLQLLVEMRRLGLLPFGKNEG